MSKIAIDASRGTHFLVDPENLFLVRDESHALWDPRVERGISEEMVASILARGVVEPVIARKNGDKIEIIDGRQRTLNALEANKRLRAEGAPTISIPVILRRDDDAEAAELGVILNEIRKTDDVITKAEKAKRLLDMGRSETDLAKAFGVSMVSIRTWLSVLDLAAVVRAAIRKGEISASEAVKELAGLEREEQVRQLEKLKASIPTARRKDPESGGGKGEGGGKKISPVSRLRRIYRDEAAMTTLSERERALIAWIFGAASNGQLVETHPRLFEMIERKVEKKPRKTGSMKAEAKKAKKAEKAEKAEAKKAEKAEKADAKKAKKIEKAEKAEGKKAKKNSDKDK